MTYLVLDTRYDGGLLLTDSPAGPVITSATPNPFNPASTLTIVIGAEVPEGEVFLRHSSYQIEQSFSSWVEDGETTITTSITPGGLPFAATLVLRVTPFEQANIDSTITIAPPSGSAAVVIDAPSFEIGSVLRGFTGNEPQDGWQMEHDDSANTTLNPDGTFTQIIQRDFQVRVWDASDYTRGAWGSAFTAAGIISVNGGEPLVAGDEFVVELARINASDVSFLVLVADAERWTLPLDSVDSETEAVFVAPDDLPTGTDFDLSLYESKTKKDLRLLRADYDDLLERVEALEA